LIKNRFLKEGNPKGSKEEHPPVEQGHEIHVHGEINTIQGGFSRGRCITSKRKKYAREVMMVEVQKPDRSAEPNLCFTKADLRDVVPHEDDHVVISFVTVERRVLRVLIDQGSSVDVMFLDNIQQVAVVT